VKIKFLSSHFFPKSRACPNPLPRLHPPRIATINSNFLKLKAGYLFPEIARRVKAYTEAYPVKAARIIRCGIGDVTEPLPAAVREAMHSAVDEQGDRATFKGYGPEQGYEFLRQAIVDNQFANMGISADEVFISDGSKCDTGNILDIFGKGNVIAITDPVYPVYVDTNVMAGNTGDADENGAYEGLLYLPCNAENEFVAGVPSERADSFISAFLTTRPVPSPPAHNSLSGSPTQGKTMRSSFSMPPTRPSFRIRRSRIPSTK
jgi:hypothetical protein